jgi:hypothetical protein
VPAQCLASCSSHVSACCNMACLPLCPAAACCCLQSSRLAALVQRQQGSVLLEVQARSCEYSRLLAAHAGITPQLLERMPALDEAEYSRNLASGAVVSPPTSSGGAGSGSGAAAAGAGAAAAAPASDDLVDLLGGLDVAAATVGRVSGSGAAIPAAATPLDDMLGMGAPAAVAGASAAGGLDYLLGTSLAPAVAAPAAATDILGMLGDAGSTAAAAPTVNWRLAAGNTCGSWQLVLCSPAAGATQAHKYMLTCAVCLASLQASHNASRVLAGPLGQPARRRCPVSSSSAVSSSSYCACLQPGGAQHHLCCHATAWAAWRCGHHRHLQQRRPG